MNDEDTMLLQDSLRARLARADAGSVWAALGDTGIYGLRVAAEHGGVGADMATASAVAEVLGEFCLPSAFIECCALARLVGDCPGESAQAVRDGLISGQIAGLVGLEPALCDGLALHSDQSGHYVSGHARLVLDGPVADFLVLVVDRCLLTAFTDDGVNVRPYATIDGRIAADIVFSNAPVQLVVDDVTSALQVAQDEAVALMATEAAALMRSLVDQTLAYVRQREQFGQPIGKFQVVQHRLVDMHIAARRAAAIARAAIAAAGSAPGERARLVSAAKATINETGRFVGQNAVQLHGGMGMTEELPVGRYFKRLTAIGTQMGSTAAHLQRFNAAMAVTT